MSVYAFCYQSCKVYDRCPAQYNPYSPMIDNEDKARQNPKGCPSNGRFMEIQRRKIHGSYRAVGREGDAS